jgi:hypothetical protein
MFPISEQDTAIIHLPSPGYFAVNISIKHWFAPEVLEMLFFHTKVFGGWSVNVNKALAARGTSEMLCKLCEIVGFDGKIMIQDY